MREEKGKTQSETSEKKNKQEINTPNEVRLQTSVTCVE